MDAFLFYAYWNGAQVRDLFESLVNITSSSTFNQVAALLVILGMIAVIAIGATRNDGRNIITYFACAVLFWFVAAVPKVSVVIEDIRSETVYTVDNVPLGVAAFGSLANRLGYWLTYTYESAFAPVDVARFSKFGAVYPERVLEVLQSVGPVTYEGRRTMDAVVSGCVTPEVLTDDTKASRLMRSVNIWDEITTPGWVNPARLVAMPDGRVLNCNLALDEAAKTLRDIELPELKKVLGTKLAPHSVDPSTSVASAIGQAEGLLLNLSRSMDASLRHALMLSVVPKAMEARLSQTQDPMAMSVTLARSQGNLASEINYRTMAKIAQDSLPRIRNAIEFVIIAMFPLMVLIALLSGSAMGGIIRMYFMLLVTVQVWPALSSVVNYLMITYDQEPFGAIAREFSGNSLVATALIRETGATSQAVAGALMCAVPVIAYALVRAGDMAVGQLVGGLTAPAQSAASAQGTSLAAGNVGQGNVQLGNISTNTVSGNKSDTSASVTDSGLLKNTTAYGSVTRSDGGEVTGIARTDINMGVGATTTMGYVRGHTSSHVGQISSVSTDAAKFSFGEALSSSDATQRSFAHAFRDALNDEKALSTARSSSESVESSSSVVLGNEMASTSSVTEGTLVGTGVHIGASRNGYKESEDQSFEWEESTSLVSQKLPSGFNSLGLENLNIKSGKRSGRGAYETQKSRRFGLEGRIQFNDAQQLLEQATGRGSTATSQERSSALGYVENALERIAKTHSDESVRSTARNMQESLAKYRTYGHDETQSITESESAMSNLNEGRQAMFQTSADGAVDVMQQSIDRFGTAEGALKAMYDNQSRTALAADTYWQGHTAMDEKSDFGLSTIVSAKEANSHLKGDAEIRLTDKDADFSTRVGNPIFESSESRTIDIDGAYQATVKDMDSRRATEGQSVDFERGILMVSREAYRLEQQDKNFAIRNAFFAAWGYQSPDQMQSKLRDIATKEPEVAQTITEIGLSQNHELDETQWNRLIRHIRNGRPD